MDLLYANKIINPLLCEIASAGSEMKNPDTVQAVHGCRTAHVAMEFDY